MPAYKYTTKSGKTKWYASFYYKDWMGVNQHKFKRGFDTKSAAKEYEMQFLDKYAKTPTILFSSLVENYFEDIRTRLKPTTIKSKEYVISTKLLPYFGEMQICNIDEDMVRRWQNELLNHRDENGEPYEDTYLYSIHSQLSALFNYAVKFYKLQRNPCRVTGAIGKSRADEMRFWTQDMFNHALEFENKTHYRIALKLLFYSGMRIGELLALTPEDIPRDEAVININKNYAIVDGTEYFLTPKTKRSFREITVPESLHAELLEYIDGMGLHPTERIFYFGKGGLTTEFKRIIKKSGNEDIRIHDLRHSHTAMLVDMGIQIEKISRRLGHESIKTTWDTYSHLYLGKAKALAQKIEILINADTEKTSSAIIPNGAVVNMAEGSPLGKVSQYILSEAERSGNDHIRRNNRHIFAKYGIDIDSEMIYGYKMLSYLDLIAFGDAIIKTISTFAPSEILKDFIISMLSDAVSSCEMINSSLENLDRFLVDVTIPNYHKLYQLKI